MNFIPVEYDLKIWSMRTSFHSTTRYYTNCQGRKAINSPTYDTMTCVTLNNN